MAIFEKEDKIWLIPLRKIKPLPLNVNVIDHETVKFSRSLFSMNMASMLWLSRRPSRTLSQQHGHPGDHVAEILLLLHLHTHT